MPTSGTYTSGEFWWIAVIMALTGCLIDATGWVIEKGTHTSIQTNLRNTDKTESFHYLCSCRWWFGFITHVFGTALFSASLAFGDASLIMPLQSATLAFNTIFAWKFLHERLNTTQIIGTIIIIVGCAFAVGFGPKSTDVSYTAYQINQLFKSLDFIIFTIVIIFIALSDFILFKFIIKSHGIFRLLSFVFMSAFFGSWNILFMKCFIEIVTSSAQSTDIHKDNVKHWIPYIMFLFICFSKITSEFWREEALKEYPGNFVGSIYTLLFIVGVILFAAVFFNEFLSMNPLYIVLFTISVAVSFIGVAMLTFGDKTVYKQVNNSHDNSPNVSRISSKSERNGGVNGNDDVIIDNSNEDEDGSNSYNIGGVNQTEKQGLVDKEEIHDNDENGHIQLVEREDNVVGFDDKV